MPRSEHEPHLDEYQSVQQSLGAVLQSINSLKTQYRLLQDSQELRIPELDEIIVPGDDADALDTPVLDAELNQLLQQLETGLMAANREILQQAILDARQQLDDAAREIDLRLKCQVTQLIQQIRTSMAP